MTSLQSKKIDGSYTYSKKITKQVKVDSRYAHPVPFDLHFVQR